MKRSTIIVIAILVPYLLSGQTLTRTEMSTMSYEDLADWLRRLNGTYLMDYGVAGAPIVNRPWGMNPWIVGTQRDGIPWSRVSDGLYESNLDTPEEFATIRLSTLGEGTTPTIELTTRRLATDSATTEFRLREGYYGFGRLDFAHGQELSPRIIGEVRGRLFWYDGMRSQAENRYSEARFYNLAGRLSYQISDKMSGELEYGGQNVDSRSPVVLLENSFARWPEIYTEREFGTASLKYRLGSIGIRFGLHARQDREQRTDPANGHRIFSLREQFHYGFAEGRVSFRNGEASTRVAAESSEFGFDDSGHFDQHAAGFAAAARRTFRFIELSAHANVKSLSGSSQAGSSKVESLLGMSARVPVTSGVSLFGDGATAKSTTPAFWRYASFDIVNRPLLVDPAFASGRYYSGANSNENSGESSIETSIWTAGVNVKSAQSSLNLGWKVVDNWGPRFVSINDTVFLQSGHSQSGKWTGPELYCDLPIVLGMKVHSLSSAQVDNNDLARAIQARTFTRLVYQNKFFKSRLGILAYAAHELIGRHRTVSEVESKVVGPANLLHFRIEGTIEGVTLIWGAENLTAQHYEYLPGYMMIRKEEYFGLKWTLKL